jgi:hypothetical protein
MSQSIAVVDLIRRSMYLINAIAAGEIPDNADLNDALLTLNEMLDGWDTQPYAVYGSTNENWVLTPGQATYNWGLTAGPTGFTTQRPVRINNATCIRNGVSTPVEVVTQDQYDSIALKSTSQPLIEKVLYINSFPLGVLTCFPVPTEAVTLSFQTDRQFATPLTLQTVLNLPPGYLRAIRYNLAVELWPEYTNSTTDITSVKNIAKQALRDIKNANSDPTPATFDDIPNVQSGRSWDWRVG